MGGGLGATPPFQQRSECGFVTFTGRNQTPRTQSLPAKGNQRSSFLLLGFLDLLTERYILPKQSPRVPLRLSVTRLSSSAAATLSPRGLGQCVRFWEQEVVAGALVSAGLAVFSLFPFSIRLCRYTLYLASVFRERCAPCRSVQRPCCRGSPALWDLPDAELKRPPQILHGWPSGNSESCSLLNLRGV